VSAPAGWAVVARWLCLSSRRSTTSRPGVPPHLLSPPCSVRYGGCEPQTVAALIGGVAAQEAVKLLTHQYLPLDNTYIFNGINGTAAALRV